MVPVRPELEVFADLLEEKLRKDFPEGLPEVSVDLAVRHLCDVVLKIIQQNARGLDVFDSTMEAAVWLVSVLEGHFKRSYRPAPSVASRSITRPDNPDAKKRSGEWRFEFEQALADSDTFPIPPPFEEDNGEET